jgi:hypothetical protein
MLLTPWSRVLLKVLTGTKLVKIFSSFYGTQRFIPAFTIVRLRYRDVKQNAYWLQKFKKFIPSLSVVVLSVDPVFKINFLFLTLFVFGI